ncbi:MAG TPA: polysaccharide lyase family protein [Phycisphaerae bacterium]|nr:polysaccharide lyase family protein [Phycisphaerae bacterium]
MFKRTAHLSFVIFNLSFAATVLAAPPQSPDVTLKDNGPTVTLSNGLISFTAAKADATIRDMHLGDSPNLAGRGAYFAVVNSGGHDGWDVHNAAFKILRQSPDLVELSFDAPIGHIHFDQHYILRRGDSGFYVFVVMKHAAADPPESNEQIRWSFYLNNQLFNFQQSTDKEQGLIPNMPGGKQVQDATEQYPDGTIYTKYNYVNYIEEDDVHGICGDAAHGGGKYGAYIIMPSKEYLQTPTKQDITVHGGPIIHRFLVSGHFEPRELTRQPITGDWTKLNGPWFVYLNSGPTPQAMWTDAKAQFKNQESQWPYQWMQNPDYPLQRADITGTLTLDPSHAPAKNALIVLTQPSPPAADWQVETLNYIFSTRADDTGHFTLSHVRPGSYTLYAMIPGVTDQFRKDNITVPTSGTLNLGDLHFTPTTYAEKIFQIGDASWRATGFNMSDLPRQFGFTDPSGAARPWTSKIPATLDFTIGKSDPAKDWYVAQANPGNWTIHFDLPSVPTGNAILTLGIAGQTRSPTLQLLANDKPIGDYKGGNSSAAYRSAIQGSSYHETKIFKFPTSTLHPGQNTLTLHLTAGVINYDCIKLELDQ